jgi:hypothetical protein
MSKICVVHLVWKPLGLQPLRDFLASYQRNPGGMNHRLVVAFNGFDREQELRPYRMELEGVPHEWFMVSPPTQDIPVYFEAAKRFTSTYFCFLNSYSVLLDEEWLTKMYAQISREGVGIVGATGSWASHYSVARWEREMRSAYDEILADLKGEHNRRRRSTKNSAFQLSTALKEKIRNTPMPGRTALWLYYYAGVAPYYLLTNSIRFYFEKPREMRRRLRIFSDADYGPFPAAHLRTNAFMISRDVFLKLRTWEMPRKEDAYRFESGKDSMTNQLLSMGLKVLVVGKDGRAYDIDEWPESETLWQGEQRNLLVADNNTRDYARRDLYTRTFLSRFAWGMKGVPADR